MTRAERTARKAALEARIEPQRIDLLRREAERHDTR